MDSNKLSFDDLVNFNDTTPLTDAMKTLDAFSAKYTSMINTVVKANAQLGSQLGAAKQVAQTWVNSLDQSNAEASKSATAYEDASKAVQDLTTQITNLKNQQALYEKTVSDLTAQLNAMTAAKNNLAKSNAAESGSIQDLKAQLSSATKTYEQLGDSVDKAVKDDAIKNIANLSTQLKNAQAAVTAAKKGVDVAAGSYTEFSNRVAAAKAQLKNMEGGLTSQGQDFKDLQKFVTDGTATLKEWDAAIGDNFRNVGNYSSALKDLKQQIKDARSEAVLAAQTYGQDSQEFAEAAAKAGELNDQLKDVQESVKATTGEPIEQLSNSFKNLVGQVAVLDFKGAQASINAFANASRQLTFGEAIKGMQSFGSSIITLGKAILTNPLFLMAAVITAIILVIVKFYKQIQPLMALFNLLGDAIKACEEIVTDFTDSIGLTAIAAEDTAKRTIKAYDSINQKVTAYYDNQIKVAQAAGASTYALELQKQKVAQASAQMQIDALNKVKSTQGNFYNWLNGFLVTQFGIYSKTLQDYSDRANQTFNDPELQKAFDDAQQNLQNVAADTKVILLKHYDEMQDAERAFAIQARNDSYALQTALIKIAQDQQSKIMRLEENGYDARLAAATKFADLAKVQAQNDAANQEQALNDQINALAVQKQRALKLVQSNESGVTEALRAAYQEQLNDVGLMSNKRAAIEAQRDKDIKDFSLSMQQQIDAINEEYATKEQALALQKATKVEQIEKDKDAKIKQINLDLANNNTKFLQDQYTLEINHYNSVSSDIRQQYDDRKAALIKASNDQLAIDKATYAQKMALSVNGSKQMLTIQQEYDDQVRANANKLKDDILAITTEQITKQEAIEQAANSGGKDTALTALNDSLNKRTISISKYTAYRSKLEFDSTQNDLKIQLDATQKLLEAQQEAGVNTVATEQQISTLKATIVDNETQHELSSRKAINAQIVADIEGTVQAAQVITDNYYQGQLNAIQNQEDAAQAQHDKAIALVQNDAAAKAAIDQTYANKKAALDKKAAEMKRKQAVADKAMAIAQAIINTAVGVSSALALEPAGIVLAALVGALGAVQIATIASTPIPNNWTGNENFEGGLTFIAERGPELSFDKDGNNVQLHTDPSIVNLKKGTIIKNAFETETILETARKFGDGYSYGKHIDGYEQSSTKIINNNKIQSNRELVNAVNKQTEAVISAIVNQPKDENRWDDDGYRKFTRRQNTKVENLNKRFSFNK